jgi:hypothetical protein
MAQRVSVLYRRKQLDVLSFNRSTPKSLNTRPSKRRFLPRPFLWRPFAIPFAAMGLRGPVLQETWGHMTCSTESRHGLCRRRNVAIFGGAPEGSFSPLLRSAESMGQRAVPSGAIT